MQKFVRLKYVNVNMNVSYLKKSVCYIKFNEINTLRDFHDSNIYFVTHKSYGSMNFTSNGSSQNLKYGI